MHECLFRSQFVSSARKKLFPAREFDTRFNLHLTEDWASVRQVIDKFNYSTYTSGGVNISSNPFVLRPKNERGFLFRDLIIRERDLPEDPEKIILAGPPNYLFGYLNDYPKLKLFLIRLYLWDCLPEIKSISANEIWNRALRMGSDFISWYNDFFDYSLRYSLEKDYDELKKYEGMDVAYMPSYSSLFPPRGILFYDVEKNDIEYMNIPSTLENTEELDSFRSYLRNLLDKLPFDEMILTDKPPLGEGSSVSVKIENNKIESRRYLSYYSKNSDFLYCSDQYKAVRCHVPVDPSSYRDTVILDYRSSNTVRLLEQTVLEILHYIPESAFGGSGADLKLKFDKLKNNKEGYSCRDIKKCGMTIDKNLLRITIEELSECPRLGFLARYIHFFDDMIIIDKDKIYDKNYILRGSGLGQANMLTTLIEIVIFYMARDKYGKPVEAIIGNDDALANRGWDFLNIWEVQEVNLGQIYNSKKSFVSRSKLFFEEYDLDGWRDKKSLSILSLGLSYMMNIRDAKTLICANSLRMVKVPDLLANLIEYHGYEFIPEEINLNYEAGGWLDVRRLGLKTTLEDFVFIENKYGHKVLLNILTKIEQNKLRFYSTNSFNMWYDTDWNQYRFNGKRTYLIKRKGQIHKYLNSDYVEERTITELIRSKLPGKYTIPYEFVRHDYLYQKFFDKERVYHLKEAHRSIQKVISVIFSGYKIHQQRCDAAQYYLEKYPNRDIPNLEFNSLINDIKLPFIENSQSFGDLGILPSLDFFMRYHEWGSIDPLILNKIEEDFEDQNIYTLVSSVDTSKSYLEDLHDKIVEEEVETPPDYLKYIHATCGYHRKYKKLCYQGSPMCPVCLRSEEAQDLIRQRVLIKKDDLPSVEFIQAYFQVHEEEEPEEDESDFDAPVWDEEDDW